MSKQTLEYYCVISDSPHGLDDNVNEKLAQGWSLHSGVSVCVYVDPYTVEEKSKEIMYTYAQAMVKPKEDKG